MENITRDEALRLVRISGSYLLFMNPEMRDDYEIVMIAVQNGYVLSYVSDRLRDNEEIVKMSACECYLNLEHASERLKSDYNFVMNIIEEQGVTVCNIGKKLLDDRRILLAILKSQGRYRVQEYNLFNTKLWNDYEILYHYILKEKRTDMVPNHLSGLPDVKNWLRIQLELKKGNGLQVYLNDYDILISFF